MWSSLLLGFMLAAQAPAAHLPGIVAGKIMAAENMTISKPLQVVLLPPEYMKLWTAEVQMRLDDYWERYKPLFAARKEYYIEVSAMAYAEGLQYVLARMQADPRISVSQWVHSSTPDGSFEFRNVPWGEYALVASGVFGTRQYIWYQSFEVNDSAPLYIPLKTHVP